MACFKNQNHFIIHSWLKMYTIVKTFGSFRDCSIRRTCSERVIGAALPVTCLAVPALRTPDLYLHVNTKRKKIAQQNVYL